MTLSEQLQDIVEGYFDRYPNMSINGLAQKSGVGATTLRRIVNGSNKGEPAPHVVLGLVSSISKEKSLPKLIGMFDGPIGELLGKTFAPYIEKDMPHEMDNDLNEVLTDQVAYFIYKLAANRKGTSRAQILDMYGKMGMDRLEKLISLNFIKDNDGELHATKKDFSLDVEIAAGHLPEMTKFYKPHLVSEGNNLFYTLSETLTEEGIQKIKEIQKEAVKRVYDIMRSPFYEGDIPYFTLQLCDTLSHEPATTGVMQ